MNKEELVAWSHLIKMNQNSSEYEANKNTCWSELWVNSNYKRQGIGTFLLEQLFETALAWNKHSISITSVDESGKRCHKKMGIGIIAQSGHENRLYLEDVDWDMINEWTKIGENLLEVNIETFEEVPDRDLEKYCKLYTECINLVPKGEEEWEAVITPETRREYEKKNLERGNVWITKVTREVNGDLSGITEIIYNPDNPHSLTKN